MVVVVVAPAAPLQLPAPQLDAPVALVVVVVASVAAPVPLHDAAPVPLHDAAPPDVVVVVVVSAVVSAGWPPPHAESPSSADAVTTSEAFVLMFI